MIFLNIYFMGNNYADKSIDIVSYVRTIFWRLSVKACGGILGKNTL